MQKSALYASVFLNIGLVASLGFFLAGERVSGVPASEAAASLPGVEGLAAKSDKNVEPRAAGARSSVLSGSQLKMLRLQELKHEHLNSIPLPRDQYWTAVPAKETADYLKLQMSGLAEIRKRLIEEFGPQARSAPEFSEVFRPLAAQHNYLSSEEQIALREFQVARQIDFLAHPSPSAFSGVAQMGMVAWLCWDYIDGRNHQSGAAQWRTGLVYVSRVSEFG